MEGSSVKIEAELYKEILEYCKVNGLKINKFCNDLLREKFMIEKYGDVPFGIFDDNKVSELKPEPKIEEVKIEQPVKIEEPKDAPKEEKMVVESIDDIIKQETVKQEVKQAVKPRKRTLS